MAMQRLVGPILHLKQGDSQTWRFTVSVWARRERGASSAKQLTLTFDSTSQATVDPTPRDAGGFHNGRWLIWNVSIPRRAAELETSYLLEGFTDGAVEVDRVVVPAVDQAPRVAFFSCNGVQHPEDWTTQPEMERLWNRMHERHDAPENPDGSAGPYHVLVGGGDQLYCDKIWSDVPELQALDTWEKRQQAKVRPALRREIEAMYASFYARWRVSWSADLLARIPGLYIWDDHEIFDGWGSYEENLQQSEVFKAIFAVARKAFMLFQLGGDLRPGRSLCLGPQEGHFLQAVHFPAQFDVLALDLRSQRTQGQVMAETQWSALKKYLQDREAAGGTAPHLLVVSSVPVVYLNFAAAERFLDWLPWRQNLEDDLRDQWESPAHQEERARLIMTLLDHAKAAQTRVTILSGDVHVGARGRITSRRPEHLLGQETEEVMHQLTSSAIVYPPPRALTLAGMRVIAKEGPVALSAISHVETEVVPLGARHFLLGQNNWLSIEPDLTWPSSRKQLWVRWVTEDGDVPPPLVIRPR
jgi:hypothetical protein